MVISEEVYLSYLLRDSGHFVEICNKTLITTTYLEWFYVQIRQYYPLYLFYSSTSVNHAVLVVGWGTHNKIPYWLIKNSCGTSFGDKGYIKIKRRK